MATAGCAASLLLHCLWARSLGGGSGHGGKVDGEYSEDRGEEAAGGEGMMANLADGERGWRWQIRLCPKWIWMHQGGGRARWRQRRAFGRAGERGPGGASR